jgi:hypothetical protein
VTHTRKKALRDQLRTVTATDTTLLHWSKLLPVHDSQLVAYALASLPTNGITKFFRGALPIKVQSHKSGPVKERCLFGQGSKVPTAVDFRTLV